MAKFMFLQRGGCEKRPEMSPEQMQQEMQAWMEWIQGGTEAGWILDPGSPLGAGAVVKGLAKTFGRLDQVKKRSQKLPHESLRQNWRVTICTRSLMLNRVLRCIIHFFDPAVLQCKTRQRDSWFFDGLPCVLNSAHNLRMARKEQYLLMCGNIQQCSGCHSSSGRVETNQDIIENQ